jgi:hypothetical protein
MDNEKLYVFKKSSYILIPLEEQRYSNGVKVLKATVPGLLCSATFGTVFTMHDVD